MSAQNRQWFCAQIGAREHYSIPRILYRKGKLSALYTDLWAGSLARTLAAKTQMRIFRSLAGRFHPELKNASVYSWNLKSIAQAISASKRKSSEVYSDFIKIGKRFALDVRASIRQRKDLNANSIFFAYDTGALEVLEWCRERGIQSILNQMDPGRAEVELVREEEKQWPHWSSLPLDVPNEYFERRETEWALAGTIVVNSTFCRNTLIKQGVAPEKVAIVPLCFEKEIVSVDSGFERQSREQIRVLFLGQVILRKGIQYLIQVAKLLEGENIRFDVVGPIGITSEAMASATKNVKFHGRVTRDQAADWYRQSDVFVLPTLSDGFAITQLEAMSYGLPVIATPCCGEVVSDGVDGFVVPARDAKALAEALIKYSREPALINDQRNAALEKVKQFSLDRLGENLHLLEEQLTVNC